MPEVLAAHDPDVETIVAHLSRRFDVADNVLRAYATEVAAMFSDARIRSFVPILMEREIRDMLRRTGITPRASFEAT